MKRSFLKYTFTLLAILFLISSCSNELILTRVNSQKAALSIELASAPLTRATQTVTQAQENAIHKIVVMVFSKGNIEARKTFNGISGKFADLYTGEKEIKVIANPSEETLAQLNKVVTLEELQKVTMQLTDEWNETGAMAAKGLTMTGQSKITLKAGNDNKATVNVKRIVAKLIIGDIIVDLEPGYDPREFKLKEVYIRHVRTHSLLGFPNYLLGEESYKYMGELETPNIPNSLGDKRLSAYFPEGGFKEEIYFYITPNNLLNKYLKGGTATGIGITAEYKGKFMARFSHINDEKIEGYEDTTGDYIQPNRQYRVNLKITKPKGIDPSSGIEVTVIPEDWVVVPDQNVTF